MTDLIAKKLILVTYISIDSYEIHFYRNCNEVNVPIFNAMSKEGDNAKVWSCVSYHGIGTLCFKEGTIHAKKYTNFIDNTLVQ